MWRFRVKTVGEPVRFSLLARATLVVALVIVVVPGGVLGGAIAPPDRSLPPSPALASTSSHPAAVPPTPAAAANPNALQRLRALEDTLLARGVPARDIHPPDYAAAAPGRVGKVQPGYDQGPAPMGISDLGLRNSSGVLVPYVYNTSSVWGSITLTRAQSAYVDGDGPDTFGVQLNAVATNVTLFGVPGYEFWAQDFFSYTSSTHTLTFGDNVWNFSSVSGAMLANVFASYGRNGTPEPPDYYYAVGPTVNVSYPFTANLYLNASLLGGLPAIYFNYSVANGSGEIAGGTFDYVAFNSSGGPSGTTVPGPAFQVNGTGNDPTGLPNDFELVLVGNGDGDTTTFFTLSATMALRQWNSTAGAYTVVPAAFNAGSDTGETSNGVLPVYRTPAHGGPPTVSLLTGPSFVEGLWNVSTAVDGSRQFHLNQVPQNAFLFISPGSTFNTSEAQWVPTLRFGAGTSGLSIPNTGAYAFEWMLSDWTPMSYTASALAPAPNSSTTLVVHPTVSAAAGVYTPLLAWGNGELAAISESGNGTAGNPYVLIQRPAVLLDPVFGQLNVWGFPVFAGVLLINTTSYVDVVQPSLAIDYGSWMAPQLSGLGLPSTNALQLEFWNVSNVSVRDSSDLSGWVSANFVPYPAAEVLFWGSHGNLVAGNTFHDQGVALALYGGENNTVWGNTIVPSSQMPSFLDDDDNTTGILEWESGDLIYNNYVAVLNPAVTPTFDAFSCQNVCEPTTYDDTWNVSLQPANASLMVLGENLTGSILGTWYQGGNYWSNYGTPADPFGVLPYDDHGLITHGGDYVPLVISTVYSVTFVESGLVPGAPWNVTLLGVTVNSTSTQLVLYAPNGTYNASVGTPLGYAGPPTVYVDVNGTNLMVPVNFTEVFQVTIHENGLVAGWLWNASCLGTSAGASSGAFNSTASSGAINLTNGTYTCTFSTYGYSVASGPAELTVNGHAFSHHIVFTPLPILSVTASGLAPGTPWTVTVTQGHSHVNETGLGDGTLFFTVLQINPGGFAWNVTVSGYSATPSAGAGTASRPGSPPTLTTASVAFVANPAPAPGFDWTWAVIVALVALAALGFALFALERHRRGRRPPKPIVPAAAVAAAPQATAWDETPGTKENAPSSPPWAEEPSDRERPEPYQRKA
jgi:thermopsin